MRFTGQIAGFGTSAGVRCVIGAWQDSPFGAFADVMVETTTGERLLLAPSQEVASFVAATYTFDTIVIGPVAVATTPTRLHLTAPDLTVSLHIGGAARLDLLLRLIPAPLATNPLWLRAIDPVAARIVPGVHTAGTAGNGRREHYGVRRTRRIMTASGQFRGAELGDLAPLLPPVRFGFASAPADPQIVSVTTTIDLPAQSRPETPGRTGE